MNEYTRQAGADQLRARIGQSNARIGFHQILTADPLRHEHLIGRPADNAAEPDQETDDVQHWHRQKSEPRCQWHCEKRQSPPHIGHDDER